MIPFEDLCAALDAWRQRRDAAAAQPTTVIAPPSFRPPAAEPPPLQPIESEGPRRREEPTSELDLDDVVN
jgi:hypothetical protein